MKKLELYLVEFEEDNIMKAKNYSLDCKAEGNKYQPIIIIIYDKTIFSSNNSICKART